MTTAPNAVTLLGCHTLTASAALTSAEWFDVNTLLGKRGHKYLSEATKYWLAACGGLDAPASPDGDRHGIVVGTNFGAHRTLTDLFTVARESGSSALSPLSSPNFSINLIASHAAIKSGARRFNLTLTTPQSAGLDALAEASRQLLRGRCDGVMAGAAEEGVRCGVSMPARLQGAMAARLVRSNDAAPGQGMARLSRFVEAHGTRPAGWKQAAQWAADSGARLFLAGAGDTANETLEHIAASVAVTGIERMALDASHGCLEPLQALHAAMQAATPSLFMYANQRGAFRAIAVEPIAPLS